MSVKYLIMKFIWTTMFNWIQKFLRNSLPWILVMDSCLFKLCLIWKAISHRSFKKKKKYIWTWTSITVSFWQFISSGEDQTIFIKCIYMFAVLNWQAHINTYILSKIFNYSWIFTCMYMVKIYWYMPREPNVNFWVHGEGLEMLARVGL